MTPFRWQPKDRASLRRYETLREWAERGAALLYPRRCPLCDAVLPAGAPAALVCPSCAAGEQRLCRRTARLSQDDHTLAGICEAYAPYYYRDSVRSAILLCKRGGRPWYARELADLFLVRVLGAEPPPCSGGRPVPKQMGTLPRWDCIVPVPPRDPQPGTPDLPGLLAARLGRVLGVPVVDGLYLTRKILEQKSLTREMRQRNVAQAYDYRRDADLENRRILLVDDILTTGSTVSDCARALQMGGALRVDAAVIAAAERTPEEKRQAEQRHGRGGCPRPGAAGQQQPRWRSRGIVRQEPETAEEFRDEDDALWLDNPETDVL